MSEVEEETLQEFERYRHLVKEAEFLRKYGNKEAAAGMGFWMDCHDRIRDAIIKYKDSPSNTPAVDEVLVRAVVHLTGDIFLYASDLLYSYAQSNIEHVRKKANDVLRACDEVEKSCSKEPVAP